MISFTSSVHSLNNDCNGRTAAMRSEDQAIDMKMDCFDSSLSSMFGCTDIDKMSKTFLAMSSTPSNCDLMRNKMVVPFLVKILHGNQLRQPQKIRRRVGRALHNIVHAHPEQKQCKREAKILRLLEVLRMYSDFLRDVIQGSSHCEQAVAMLSQRGCGQLRLNVVMDENQREVIVCGKYFGQIVISCSSIGIICNLKTLYFLSQVILYI